MNTDLDLAIELLEIVDISTVRLSDIQKLSKKSKSRWHPDKVSHSGNEELISQYTKNFQKIDWACQVLTDYLNGDIHSGASYDSSSEFYKQESEASEEPEEVIRRNAKELQENIRSKWNFVKEKKFQHEQKENILSDGFSLRDLLDKDFADDISALSMVSLYYGTLSLSILVAIIEHFSKVLGFIALIPLLLHIASCTLGAMPLSRFWLPEVISDFAIKFINFGLAVYNRACTLDRHANKWWLTFIIQAPLIFSKAVKYLVLWPCFELAKLFVGDKVVGVVKENLNYYAGFADWYIEDLMEKDISTMSSDELFHLSLMNSEFSKI